MEERRKELVAAARELYEEKGYEHTSVKDITEHCGVTRSLFYHYFPDKRAITSAVLDNFIEDFTESVCIWNENRVQGDVEGALRDCIKMLRRVLFDTNYFREMLVSDPNASLYLEFLSRATAATSYCVVQTTVKDYGAHHDIKIEYVRETFFILIMGLVGYLRSYPDTDDEVLMAIVTQILHLEV